MLTAQAPEVSVVVPAYRMPDTLPCCVESLMGQEFDGRFEIIVVASADCSAELVPVPEHPAVRYVGRVPRCSAARARNLGVSMARGAALAFTDADVVADPRWLQSLVRTGQGKWCVAGSFANGTPASLAGTIEYLIEFFDLSPARWHPPEHGATGNLFLPRQLWERYGPFPEDMEGCEDTWLTTQLRRDGLLRFEPEAVIHHINRQTLREVFRHQYALGAAHARLAVAQGAAPRAPVRAGIAATRQRIAWFYRSTAMWTPDQLWRAVRLGPLLILGFGAWGAGLTAEARRLSRSLSSAGPSARAPAPTG